MFVETDTPSEPGCARVALQFPDPGAARSPIAVMGRVVRVQRRVGSRGAARNGYIEFENLDAQSARADQPARARPCAVGSGD